MTNCHLRVLTISGMITLKMPKLKGVTNETAIIERHRRRERSVEEALIEMYLAGVSVRRVDDITEVLWGTRVSAAGTVSELNKKVYVHIDQWRSRPLTCCYPYVYLNGIYLKRNWGGEYENVSILVASAVNEDGYREVIGASEGMKEHKAWEEVTFESQLRVNPNYVHATPQIDPTKIRRILIAKQNNTGSIAIFPDQGKLTADQRIH